MSVPSCPCGRPGTHKIEIKIAPIGSADPGLAARTQWGVFAAEHVPTLAQMQREYARIGLDVIEYLITELVL